MCRHGRVVSVVGHEVNVQALGRESGVLSGPEGGVHVGHEVGAVAGVAHVEAELGPIMPGESGEVVGSVPELGEATLERRNVWPAECVTQVTNRGRVESGATE